MQFYEKRNKEVDFNLITLPLKYGNCSAQGGLHMCLGQGFPAT